MKYNFYMCKTLILPIPKLGRNGCLHTIQQLIMIEGYDKNEYFISRRFCDRQ